MTNSKGPRTTRIAVSMALVLGLSTPALPTHAQVRQRSQPARLLVSAKPHAIPADLRGTARLLIHDMPSMRGGVTRASTLLFVPYGAAPAGGWPIVAWAHGTTTPGQKTCAPSLSPDLDGGLTRDGFVSYYAYQIAGLVNVGYAVVAPDFEGLGPVATVPHPYFSSNSLARSVISGVLAAHEADPALSKRWAVFGHSEGGHAALAVEAHAAEAPALTFLGTVASAPFTSIAAIASRAGRTADTAKSSAAAATARLAQNFPAALMTAGLMAQPRRFDPGTVVGADLRRVLHAFRTNCSMGAVGVITKAIEAKGQARFAGLKPGWDKTPRMAAFLTKNDLAVTPGFTMRRPTLIVQGTADASVPEPLTTAFAACLKARGAPVTYKRYPGANHSTITKLADADVLAFLQTLFKQ